PFFLSFDKCFIFLMISLCLDLLRSRIESYCVMSASCNTPLWCSIVFYTAGERNTLILFLTKVCSIDYP
ncbi:MAG TPA: hypothetical protein PLU33_08925, partial [Treponemataceae bacterium]|nr:hypothetical protein [Treponemataceae bacterium]